MLTKSTIALAMADSSIGLSCRASAGRPIDFVAAGIAGTLSNQRSGLANYHVVNPHWDDGVSLDAIVGWLAEARGGVKKVADYAQWCARPECLWCLQRARAWSCLLLLWLVHLQVTHGCNGMLFITFASARRCCKIRKAHAVTMLLRMA